MRALFFFLAITPFFLGGCGEPETPVSVEAQALEGHRCSDVPIEAGDYDLELLEAHLDEPALIDDGVLFVPEHIEMEISPDGRRMQVAQNASMVNVLYPGPGPRPGTFWDCQCGADDDSGCYWRHLRGLSWCKGSCGETRCGAVVIEELDVDIVSPF